LTTNVQQVGAPPPLLELRAVTAGYGPAAVLHDVELTVNRGEVVALLGTNGAGKTTTLRIAAGILATTSGQVLVDGAAATRGLSRRARSGLSYVPEERGLIRALSVEDNLKCAGVSKEQALRLFPEIEPRLRIRGGLLSGGEQQMLALAIALGRYPKLLLADELSLGLAPMVVTRLLQAVRTAADDAGTGVLLVEQHAKKALRYADRAYLMQRGKVLLSLPAAEMVERLPELESAYL
jgi:branched-chain amino acid transport system ATP-binding protein